MNTASQAAANLSGYRLSGASVSSFSGQRVQVVGVIVPPATAGTAGTAGGAGAVGTTGTAGPSMQEFRVQSVQPISGDCPRQ